MDIARSIDTISMQKTVELKTFAWPCLTVPICGSVWFSFLDPLWMPDKIRMIDSFVSKNHNLICLPATQWRSGKLSNEINETRRRLQLCSLSISRISWGFSMFQANLQMWQIILKNVINPDYEKFIYILTSLAIEMSNVWRRRETMKFIVPLITVLSGSLSMIIAFFSPTNHNRNVLCNV